VWDEFGGKNAVKDFCMLNYILAQSNAVVAGESRVVSLKASFCE